MSNRIWITGANGFIGQRLMARLRSTDTCVEAWDHSSGHDVANWEDVRTMSPFDVVIHLAGRTFVPASFEQPHDYYHVNAGGTLNVLEICRRHRARLIYVSAYVYGPPQYLPIDERHPVQPTNPYTQSKWLGEELCRAYHRDFGVKSTILRVFNIYGPGQPRDFLIPSILRQLPSGRISLQDPTPRRDFVHVDDVVEACCLAMNRSGEGSEIFNVGSGESVSVEQLVTQIVQAWGRPVSMEFTGQPRAGEITDTRCDIAKARQQLGWSPRIPLADGLRALLKT